MCGGAASDSHGYFARVKVELLASTDALSEETTIYPPLKLRVFVDDIMALLMEKNKVLAEMAKKVMERLREEVGEKGLKLSVTESGREGKSKMIASCRFLEDELHQCSKQCRNVWSRPEN